MDLVVRGKIAYFASKKNVNVMTIGEVITDVERRLEPAVGQGEARAMAHIIIETVKGYKPVEVAMNRRRELLDETVDNIHRIVGRVLEGEPLQYVLGTARFAGRDFEVTPATLIPRPETSQLVDFIAKEYDGRPDLRVLDIGTGSGCIAVTLAAVLPFAKVTALDISPEALDVARRNAARYHVKVDFVQADILNYAVKDSFDIIVSNPPYVLESERKDMDARVVDHEPASALFVPDSDPLRFYRPIGRLAAGSLAPGGSLWLEINPLCVDALRAMLAADGFASVDVIRDYRGVNRFICAKR